MSKTSPLGEGGKACRLKPIGSIQRLDNRCFVHILKAYRPALKFLDQFSHAILFYRIPDNNLPRRIHNQPGLDFSTVKLFKIDETSGILEIDDDVRLDGSVLFDMKPYFPCEDRVKEPLTPASMKDWSKWRNETDNPAREIPLHLQKDLNTLLNEDTQLSSIGEIRMLEGEYVLKLGSNAKEALEVLEGYSHLRVLWWFDRFDKESYRQATQGDPPYENAPRTGIFATRSPVRPNPLAVTTARILKCDQNTGFIKITALDAFDKTPVMAVVPYIPAFDRVLDSRVPQWLSHWPQFLDDRENIRTEQDLKLLEPDSSRLQAYLVENEKEMDQDLQIESSMGFKSALPINEIQIKGARQNNLKGIDCSIPKNKLTVITGVSGSGKSSLAFDTLYAESQRRLMDLLSNSGRGMFDQMDKPEVDQIIGLPPAIAIEQKAISRNPRSTVGTLTGMDDYIKLFFVKTGTRHCPDCGRAITPLRSDEITALLLRLRESTSVSLKPHNDRETECEFIVPGDKEEFTVFENQLGKYVKEALSLGKGAINVLINGQDEFLLQTTQMCYSCDRIFFELTPSTFSFNNPESMCPVCKGLGVKLEVDAELIVSHPEMSLLDGASKWWRNLRKFRQKPNANWMKGEILGLADMMGVDLEKPWEDLPEAFKKQALYGSEGKEVSFLYENSNGRKGEITRPVEGAFNSITRLFHENSGNTASRIAEAFMSEKPCSACRGERLADEGRLVSIADKRYPEVVRMTLEELKAWLDSLSEKLTRSEYKLSYELLAEISRKLDSFIQAGIPYLTLDRSIPSLSGGEAQRLRLASQLGGGITNMLYILDEPSMGLHSRDHQKLIGMMRHLVDEGNTLVVVEHDAETMLAADRILDIGPGAGLHGGTLLAEGTPEEIMNNPMSVTGRYLGILTQPRKSVLKDRRKPSQWIRLKGAKHNNLKNVDVSIPLGVLTCVTGVSGSGKSSLISKTLAPAMTRRLSQSDESPGPYDSMEGTEIVMEIVSISQQPIGRTPRSNPATYCGVFDDIRTLFAIQEESKRNSYTSSKFSFNSKEGQCEACGGEGRKCVPMHFMPDIWVECPTCKGKRFNKEALRITYRGKTIADVLAMNVEEALSLFHDNPKIENSLNTLAEVGLGYIQLGQSALSLSGGEAQRVKLAKELSRRISGHTLYLLDEPTSGLHFSDTQKLLAILKSMTEKGHTVLVIEHNMDIIGQADWIIDLGPEGGQNGGYLVGQGTPEEVAAIPGTHTGAALRRYLGFDPA